MVQAADHNFYGTMSQGAGGCSTIFRMTTNGVVTVPESFSYAGDAVPYSGLVVGNDGYMYGTAALGGTYGLGTVFRLDTNGNYTLMASFNNANGYAPGGRAHPRRRAEISTAPHSMGGVW